MLIFNILGLFHNFEEQSYDFSLIFVVKILILGE